MWIKITNYTFFTLFYSKLKYVRRIYLPKRYKGGLCTVHSNRLPLSHPDLWHFKLRCTLSCLSSWQITAYYQTTIVDNQPAALLCRKCDKRFLFWWGSGSHHPLHCPAVAPSCSAFDQLKLVDDDVEDKNDNDESDNKKSNNSNESDNEYKSE